MNSKCLAAFGCVVLTACGGGSIDGSGSGNGSNGSANNGDPAGIYSGTVQNSTSGTTDTLIGVIDANHQAVFVDQTNPAIFRFTSLSVSGNSFTGTFNAYAGSGQVFPNGQVMDSGTANGTFVPQSSLSATTTVGGNSLLSTIAVQYQASLYEIPASFTTVMGTYSYSITTSSGIDTSTIAIASNGTFSGSDTFGCTYSGSLTIPDTTRNAYEINGSTTCGGAASAFTGLGTYVPASNISPAQITFEYDDGSTVAVAATATRQ